jgi:hypothetical protein
VHTVPMQECAWLLRSSTATAAQFPVDPASFGLDFVGHFIQSAGRLWVAYFGG